ncbi:hypothetical protein HHI36_021840 [Cryptolaemus montrouzieri]|uniref:Non-homologous end-joining factor 1 n=1 Tax=Cryptolaemus montrouzieri TaxID=559131 RepID=A0ABD2MY37_9CUCU
MWKTFVCDNNQYIIKVVPLENCIQVNLSDLKTIWREELSHENLSNRFKEANQSLGGTEENVKEQIITLINNINEAMKVQIEKKSLSLSLKITSKLDIFNLNFEFLLSRLSEETFYSEVTGPLVRTVRYLEEKELIMRNLLIKKDRELQEYKLEKGNITRGT